MTPPQAPRPSLQIGTTSFGAGRLFLIAGPCMLESRELALSTAAR